MTPPRSLPTGRAVAALFDDMARTYGLVHLFSSLGFAYLWRRGCVRDIPGDAKILCDLMSGQGECRGHLRRRFGPDSPLTLVDFSAAMCERASAQIQRTGDRAARTLCCDALDLPLTDASVDVVVSTFGLKTFTDDEWLRLGREVARILKPGGRFAFLEFSVPPSPLLRLPFRLYVQHYVPFVGRLMLGNPDHYRLLWRFTSRFGNCQRVAPAFRQAGLEASVRSRFFGCATELIGKRPE